jgi:hypothetical protein
MSGRERITLNIGDVLIGIDCCGSCRSRISGGLYRDFLFQGEPEVSLTIHHHMPRLRPRQQELVFDSLSHWRLFRSNGANIVTLETSEMSPSLHCMAVFGPDFRQGDIYLADMGHEDFLADQAPSPLDHSLMQILTVCLMSKGRGLLVHACGVEWNGRGYLFAGNSGHGKSTMARLWNNQGLILNDDRILLSRRQGRTRMHGTPWHGDHKSGLSRGLPVEKCFFLEPGKENRAISIEGAHAGAMLLARSFPPLWDKWGMAFTLDFLSMMVAEIPFYKLAVVPTEDVVEFVKCLS